MPNSRSASPANQDEKPKDEEPVITPYDYHAGLAMPSPDLHYNSYMSAARATAGASSSGTTGNNAGNASGGISRKRFKYVKPRMGGNFQAKVADYIPPNPIIRNGSSNHSQDGNTSNMDDSNSMHGIYGNMGSSTPAAASENQQQPSKKRKAGRPFKGMRGKIQESNEPETYDPRIKPKRGGLLIHKPQQKIRAQNEFLAFGRNIMLQTPNDRNLSGKNNNSGGVSGGNSSGMTSISSSTNNNHYYRHSIARADYLWREALIEKRFGVKMETQKPEGKKRGRKRKLNNSNSGRKTPPPPTAESGSVPSRSQSRSRSNTPVNTRPNTPMNMSMSTGSDNNQDTSNEVLISRSASVSVSSSSVNDLALGMEGDEHMLEYLQKKGRGDVGRAEFLALVELCRGRAVLTRKRIKKKKKLDDMSVPLSAMLAPQSDSWRRRYERMGSTILGDFRRNPGSCKYPYFGGNCHTSSHSSIAHPWTQHWGHQSQTRSSRDDEEEQARTTGGDGAENKSATDVVVKGGNGKDKSVSTLGYQTQWDDLENESIVKELTETWHAILDCGQMILENQKKGKKSKMRDLFILLAKANSIPKPEDVYGRRDSVSKHISQCLNSILDHIEQSRDILAELTDAIYDENGDGIELQALRKKVDSKSSSCKVELEEIGVLEEMLNEGLLWEAKLAKVTKNGDGSTTSDEDLHLPQQNLVSAEAMAQEGRLLSLRSISLVALEGRIHRAYDLRERIRFWSKNNSNEKDSVKTIGSMIKEANRINLGFPELSLLSKVHRNAEEWMDRANVALRSKISLVELESLVETGEKMPLGLTTTLEKLKSRFKQACEWIMELKEQVPCPLESVSPSGCNLDAGNRAEWLLRMRQILQNGEDEDVAAALVDLSAQGSRLSVEIDILQLLQTAIDARNWSQKAKRWVPSSGDQFRRGKIDDINDHLGGSNAISSRANALTDGKCDWNLEYSEELQSIVDEADKWFERYRPILTGDNRRVQGRCSLSYAKLKQIVDEADKIPANLGNSSVKINRIFNEAKNWIEENYDLLTRCGVPCEGVDPSMVNTTSKKPVSIDEVTGTIDSASKNLAVDLDEIKKLKDMAAQSRDWFEKALEFAPKRKNRVGSKKAACEKQTIQEVISLIEASASVPMDTTEDVERLRLLLSDVQAWRLEAQMKIREVSSTLKNIRSERIQMYGVPEKFLGVPSCEDTKIGENIAASNGKHDAITNAALDNLASSSNKISRTDAGKGGDTIYKMVEKLLKSSDDISILSLEEEMLDHLHTVMKWCKMTAEIIESHENVFIDKRWKKDLDKLIDKYENLPLACKTFISPMPEERSDESAVFTELGERIIEFVSDDLKRLKILQEKRNEYYLWCQKANDEYIESDKRVAIEKLQELANQCSIYPTKAETVKRIVKDARVATEWVVKVRSCLESGAKLSLEEVKTLLNKVTRVKFTCPEYKNLKKAHQDAKSWTNRVKKSGLENGSAQIHVLKELLRAHDDLIIGVPEEAEALKQSLCGYCICRRPYEGFMIGCDDCEEWYHGSCIGMTKAQGERIDKYVCVRCCVKRVYKTSCNKVASIIRKWCDQKELSKARSQDNQKHQRKIREKKRETMKWKEELESSVQKMHAYQAQKVKAASTDPSLPNGSEANPVQYDEAHLTNVKYSITKSTAALEQCNRRMEELVQMSNDRKMTQRKEDQMAPFFRYWSAVLRETVLTPETLEKAQASRPKPTSKCLNVGQLMSEPMGKALELTTKLGISNFPDVTIVRENFQCIGWCCLAFEILMKKPHIEDLKRLHSLSDIVKLPEVKSVGMIRSMISRSSAWRGKVNKALTPATGEVKPFNTAVLKELSIAMTAIPVSTPEETKLCNAIVDEGARHCICGGPRDSSMTSCSTCGKYFHFKCLNIDEEKPSDTWKCSSCENGLNSNKKMKIPPPKTAHAWPFGNMGNNDISPHAPIAEKMWPPFGLANSPEALGSLGVSLTFKVAEMKFPVMLPSSERGNVASKMRTASSTQVQSNPNIISSNVGHGYEANGKPKEQVSKIVQLQHTNAILATPKSNPTSGQKQPASSSSVLTMRFPTHGIVRHPCPPKKIVKVAAPIQTIATNPIIVGNTPLQMSKTKPPFANIQTSVPSENVDIDSKMVASIVQNSKDPVTPFVEGLANGVVQDALLVARDVAKNMGQLPLPVNDSLMTSMPKAAHTNVPGEKIVPTSAALEHKSSLIQSDNSNPTPTGQSKASFPIGTNGHSLPNDAMKPLVALEQKSIVLPKSEQREATMTDEKKIGDILEVAKGGDGLKLTTTDQKQV